MDVGLRFVENWMQFEEEASAKRAVHSYGERRRDASDEEVRQLWTKLKRGFWHHESRSVHEAPS